MKKRYTVEEKVKLIEEISKMTTVSVKEACKAAGISDCSYYSWRKELSEQDVAMEQKEAETESAEKEIFENEIEKKEGKPISKTEIDEEVEKLVVDLKKKYPYYGIVRISQELLRFDCVKISPSKVLKILEKNNLNTGDFYRARKAREVQRFERSRPNELWSTDIMPYRLKNGDKFYFIGIEDDFSRYVLSHGVFVDAKVENIIAVLQDAVASYGLPKEILTDRGGQFHTWKGMSGFEKLLANYGIRHTMSKPHNPSCNGKIESVHRNIQKELLWRKFMNNYGEAKEEIRKYMDYYNHERPHQGIGGLVPADRYFKTDDDVKNNVLKANLNGVKVYFNGKVNKTMYRIEQRGSSLMLVAGGNIVEEWSSIDALPQAFESLGGILKYQKI